MAKDEPKSRITEGQILQAIGNASEEEQRDGWDKLYHGLHGGTLQPDAAFTNRVFDLMRKTKNTAVLKSMYRAVEQLFYVMCSVLTPAEPPHAGHATGAEGASSSHVLGSWLWAPFQDRSWLLRLIDARQRDERAAMTIGRRLSFDRFAAVQWIERKLHEFTFTLGVTQPPKAVVFVGRPKLFFAPTEPRTRWEMENARYRFGDATASSVWPDPEFHCLYEPLGASLPPRPHRTQLVQNELTDYGLVQRYTALIDGVPVVVLVIAGATFVGTYAAAYWAACSLFGDPQHTAVIPVPGGLDQVAEFEALIEVRATLDRDETRHPPMRTRLCDLWVTGKQWNPGRNKWEKSAPRDIVLVSRQTQHPTPQDIEELWLDRRPAALRDEGEARRLLAALCLHAEHHAGVISFQVLLDDSTIGLAKPLTLQRLRTQLRALKQRHLGSALEITEDGWQLKARVHLAPQ